MRFRLIMYPLLFLASALLSCGSGGGGGTATTAPIVSPPASASTPTTSTPTAGAAVGSSAGGAGGLTGPGVGQAIYELDLYGPPRFVDHNPIDLTAIRRISRFRSAVGHDYSDGAESCRSMKHYLEPKASVDWATVALYSPVDGVVVSTVAEWAGWQVQIRSDVYPAFVFVLFHLNLARPLTVGDALVAGEYLGTHIGPQTMSDVAVSVTTPAGHRLVSFVDVATDPLFTSYLLRGAHDRSAFVISQQERDANPLSCSAGQFGGTNTHSDWVVLN